MVDKIAKYAKRNLISKHVCQFSTISQEISRNILQSEAFGGPGTFRR